MMNPSHLFISYASEDAKLATWLARKLAARGHSVWFDKIKLLGGEPWPQTIDDAIKNRTFRMLALISVNSLRKSKPTGERTLAQRIAEQRAIPDYLIPLKVDDSELDWLTSTVSYVSFVQGWADGWRALLKKLDSIAAPRLLINAAPLAASSFPRGDDLVNPLGEKVFTNVIRVKSFPAVLQVYRVTQHIEPDDWAKLKIAWAFYEIDRQALIALIPPPLDFVERVVHTAGLLWAEFDVYRNVRCRDIAVNLILKVLAGRLTTAGCLVHPNLRLKDTFYLPESFSEKGKLSFVGYRGKSTWLQIRGKVTFRKPGGMRQVNYHHFAFRMRLARGLDKSFYVQLTPTLVLFDEKGQPILDKSVGPRRRRLTKMWFNDKWLNRLMASANILAMLSSSGPDDLLLESELIGLSSPRGLNESLLKIIEPEQELEKETPEDELALDETETEQTDE